MKIQIGIEVDSFKTLKEVAARLDGIGGVTVAEPDAPAPEDKPEPKPRKTRKARATKEKPPETAETPQPSEAAEPEKPQGQPNAVTITDVKAEVMKASEKGTSVEQFVELFGQFKAKSIGEIKVEDYPQVIAAIKGLSATPEDAMNGLLN